MIETGDFIKSKGLAVYGFVIRRVTISKGTPAFLCNMGDKEGLILEAEAELMHKKSKIKLHGTDIELDVDDYGNIIEEIVE